MSCETWDGKKIRTMQKMSLCFICHINSNNEQSMYKMSYVQAYPIIYMQAKQKLLHRKDRKLIGMLNMRLLHSALQKSSQKNIEWENE